jgi:hypothetical protein
VAQLADPSTASAAALPEAPPARQRAKVTTLDVLALGAVLLVALLGWSSLALAHLGHHSLPGALLLTFLGLVAVFAVILRWARPEVVSDRPGVLVALGGAAVALALTFPGFSYGVADKDPGGYVSHAVSIAHTGDYRVHDALSELNAKDPSFPLRFASPGARFAGVWVHDAAKGEVVPQFYHLWPALLADAYDAAGTRGIRATTPVVGALSVLLLVALLRRVGNLLAGPRVGLAAAAIGGLLLTTNMLQVWQARYPTTEVLSEALFLGALLGIVLALHPGWSAGAAVAGLLVGVGFLNRPDAVLLVVASAGVGAALLALGRWDGRAWWFTGGLAVVLPHALLQAYDLAKSYSVSTGVPGLRTVLVLCFAVLAAGLLIGRVLRGPVTRLQELVLAPRAELVLGALVVLGVMGLIGLGFLRPRLFGVATMDYNGHVIRSYDEQSLRRLSWFLTLPAFALLPCGVALVALRRWRGALWAVTLPTLLLFPVYAYHARNSTRLMWWTRRFVPTVLPGVVILLALALAFAAFWQFRGRAWLRVPAVLVTASLVAVYLQQSLPLRRHDEWRGSFALSSRVAALAHGRTGIYLWEPDASCCNGPTHLLPTTLWLQHDQMSALLAPNLPAQGITPAIMVSRYRQSFPRSPVFIVSEIGTVPDGVEPAGVTLVDDVRVQLPMWDESDVARPAAAHQVLVRMHIWQVNGT